MPPQIETLNEMRKERRMEIDVSDSIVEVIVGSGSARSTFQISKTLLYSTSSFFKAALEGRFKEGIDQRIELGEDNIEVFQDYHMWLYTKRVPYFDNATDSKDDMTWAAMVDLYAFAEVRGIPMLQNYVIKSLIDASTKTPWTSIELARQVYDRTPEGSPLRRLYVDMAIHEATPEDPEWFGDGMYEIYPKAFLFDVVRGYCQMIQGRMERSWSLIVAANYQV